MGLGILDRAIPSEENIDLVPRMKAVDRVSPEIGELCNGHGEGANGENFRGAQVSANYVDYRTIKQKGRF